MGEAGVAQGRTEDIGRQHERTDSATRHTAPQGIGRGSAGARFRASTPSDFGLVFRMRSEGWLHVEEF